ncbi:hypothetical protein JHK85_026708 [Glycine max]|uniref:Uncharacterized protein n=1 Tax=Glycine max TaxID=3847 RepID=A0A0R0ID02_SOYBN|nr:hypothetical protein JHK85_026708 [Glycine max]
MLITVISALSQNLHTLNHTLKLLLLQMNHSDKPKHFPTQPSDLHLLFPCSRHTESLLATLQCLAIRILAAAVARQSTFPERHELLREIRIVLARAEEEALAPVQQRHRQVRDRARFRSRRSFLSPEAVPYLASLVVERRRFYRRRGNADDVAGDREEVRGDVPEFGLAFGGGGGCGGGGADGGGVRDIDARVPEAVAELPNLKLQQVRKRNELTQLSQALPEIGGSSLRRGFVGGASFELFNDCFNFREATVVSHRVSVE